MGINPSEIKDRLWQMMDAGQRKAFGKIGRTQSEIANQQALNTERRIHNDFIGFLRRNQLPYVHADMSRKSHLPPGHPDFLITRNHFSIYIEFKVPPNPLSQIQIDYIQFLLQNSNIVHVVVEDASGAAYTCATNILTQLYSLL